MALKFVREVCSCGASIEIDGYSASFLQSRVQEWRSGHKCIVKLAPEPESHDSGASS